MISNRRESYQELKDSNEKFQTIINNILDTIVEIDLNGNFTFISPQCKQMFGFEPHEVIGKKALNFIYPEDLKGVIKKMQEAIENKGIISFEYRAKHKRGDYIHVSAKGGLISTRENSRLLGVIRDITEKKRAERELRNSEQQYKTIIESIGDPIHVIDENYDINFVNSTLENWVKDYNIGTNLVGKKLNEVFPFLPQKVFEEYRRVFNAQEVLITEEENFLNGKEVFTEVRKIPIIAGPKTIQVLTILRDITDKVKVNRKLKESEKRYRKMIEDLDVAFYRITLDGTILSYNPAFNKILRVDQSTNLKGANVSKFWLNPNERDDYLENLIINDTVKNYIVNVRTENGKNIIIQLNSHLIKDLVGNPIEIEGTFTEITEKFVLEQRLKESEKKYRNILENTKDAIVITDFKGRFLYVSPQLSSIMDGIDIKPGTNWSKLIHPEDIGFLVELLRKGSKHKKILFNENVEFRTLDKMGKIIWISSSSNNYYNEYGEIIGFISSLRDVTDKKQAEQKLKESEEKYRHLFENSPNGNVLSDKKGIILEVNKTAGDIVGFKPNELIGKNFAELGIFTSTQISLIREMYREYFKGVNSEPVEFQITKKNGNKVWTNYQNSMIKLDNDILIETTIQDITEKKKAEELIKEENKRLLEITKMKNDLISRVSHELKTPLNSIYGGAQILLNLYKDRICLEAMEFIEMINKGGRRLKELIDNLLDTSRIESGKLKLNLKRENLVEILMECVNDIRYIANERRINLEINFPGEIHLEIDKLRIEQVITNLLSNAIKNTPSQGIITIQLREADDSVYIEVKDTGVGLTKKDMDIIFKKFGKIERYGKKMDVDIEGSGLGLYISKEIIDLHGGSIWVESEGKNKGSTFIIRLYKKPDFIFI